LYFWGFYEEEVPEILDMKAPGELRIATEPFSFLV